jgi:hypothetical protein
MYLSYSLKPNDMDSKKFVMGTLAGGISFFLLGYLFYGLVLNGFFMKHSLAPAGSMRGMSDIVWWSLILGNLAGGALLTWIFLKLGNIRSFGSGFGTGASIGFFLALSMDLIRYATEVSTDHTGVIADVAVGTVMNGIVGGIIGVALGMGFKKA